MADPTEPAGADTPVAGEDYPIDLAQLRAWFASEEACWDYLDWLRWPEGFVCPRPGCEGVSAGEDSAGRYRCHQCRRRISVTAGTIFHRSRIPLSVWFEAAWLLSTNKAGVSAAYLHRVLPISSYQSAWTMLAKLRSVMGQHGRRLAGTVEVDETFIGGPRAGVRGRGAADKTLVAGAVEITENGWGRARLAIINDATVGSLKEFIAETIEPGATVITDGLNSYSGALGGYEHQVFNVSASGRPAHESLPAVHRLFSQVKRLIEGTYQGSGSHGHRGEYLDEFIFRFNRRRSTHRGMVFHRLLQRAVAAEPVTYRQLVRDSKPKARSPKGLAGPRSQPGSLHQGSAGRPWRAPRRGATRAHRPSTDADQGFGT
ncbi:IS1595 family transposase [Nesterenkonia alkaliphila]|uniref:IS1595 family transposase n=1 Tax=Nesterenkonia alkaliphila TaxID=1463631 RepID=UPI001666A62C|nr:IS1595 family transposase [Nesterenkonia alkaliphila]GGA00851.1 IS1595 family transposase [Nesterenkonia alkaliphila]